MPTKFYSPQMQSHKLTYDSIGDSYRFFNFAMLRTSGLNMVLDTMRYDQAFFCRKSDVDRIIEVLDGKLRFATENFSILLAKFDWKGKTKPNWTPQRLTSSMEYEFITDPMDCYQLGSDLEVWHIKPPAKLKSTIELTGTPAQILRVMYANRAFPENENDAHRIERSFYSPKETITVKLQTYTSKEQEWLDIDLGETI